MLLKYLVFLGLLIAAVFSTVSSAQQLTGDQIKSAYLFNFLKHVTWPDESSKTSYTVAIYRDNAIFLNIYQALNNRTVKNKAIVVVSVDSLAQASKADLAFITNKSGVDLAEIASAVRNTGTLLVTDNSNDKRNTMINLVFNPATLAISFEVNRANIVLEQLKLSSELLLLGGTEIDVARLYRTSELAMQKMREREIALNATLSAQTKQMNEVDDKLQRLNGKLKQQQQVAEQRKVELLSLKKNIELQKLSISSKEEQLKEVLSQLTVAKSDLQAKQQLTEKNVAENKAMAERIIINRNILEQQQAQIDQQGEQLTQKNEELAIRKERIDQQRLYLLVLAGVIILAVAVGLLIIWLFVKNKRTTRKLSQTLTNLKDTQDQLIQSEKLASLGKLTAGVAHEINTPLGIAVTSTSSALEDTKAMKENFERNAISKSALARYFSAIDQAAELNMSSLNRVIELLNNFKQVAADQVVGEVRRINVADYIAEVMQTLSAELKRCRVDYRYDGRHDIEMKTIPGALAQILTNLVTNSLKHGFAQSSSGNITIDVSQTPTNDIELTYTDDGEGMSTEILQNIYEPFFTTKRHAGGTGLGMNIVHNIITQKLDGHIDVSSTPQQGTRFVITLPKELTNR